MKLPVKIPQGITRAFGRAWLKTKKASPEICVISGILCGGAAVVMVGVKTWKNRDKLADDISAIKETSKNVKEAKEQENAELAKEEKKELIKVSGNLVKDISKTYWIPATLSIASVGLIWGGHSILRKRLSATTAAYAMLLESYKRYRQRVVEEYGAEKDLEYAHGVKMVDAVDAETGEIVKKAMVDRDKSLSPYARWFDEGAFDSATGQWLYRNYAWRDSPMLNEAAIRSAQVTANQMLKANGYLFLNDVYKLLGLPMSVDGQIVGWDLCGGGDGYIDFGVFPENGHQLPVNRLLLDGTSPNALLDFNVDGPILGALEKTWGPEQTAKLIAGRW